MIVSLDFRPVLLPLLAGAVLIGCAATGTPRAAFKAPVAPAARAADASGFHDLAGKPASLAAFAGSPVVVTFLAPGEPESDAQLPHVIRLADAYAPKGVKWLVSGERASAADLSAFVAAHGLAFPVWEDRDAAEWRRRGFRQLPAHEFRRADGSVQHARDGFMSRGELLEQLEALK